MNEIVSIFLWAPKAPRVKAAEYKYILVYKETKISGGSKVQEVKTGHQLIMMALIEALGRMRKPSVIEVKTNCNYLITGHQHLTEWERNGWKRDKNQALKNADLWQQIKKLEAQHAVRCTFEDVNLIF